MGAVTLRFTEKRQESESEIRFGCVAVQARVNIYFRFIVLIRALPLKLVTGPRDTWKRYTSQMQIIPRSLALRSTFQIKASLNQLKPGYISCTVSLNLKLESHSHLDARRTSQK